MLKTCTNIFFLSFLIARSFLKIGYTVLKAYIIILFNKILYWIRFAGVNIYIGSFYVWAKTPWWKAYTKSAWDKYMKTSLYRDRLVSFGEEFALSSYIGEDASKGDISHFKRKVRKDRPLMTKIVLMPYSIF